MLVDMFQVKLICYFTPFFLDLLFHQLYGYMYLTTETGEIMEETKLHEIMKFKDKSLEELRAKHEELFDGQKPGGQSA